MTINKKELKKWLGEAAGRGIVAVGGVNRENAAACTDLLWPASVRTAGDTLFCLARLKSGRALLIEGPEAASFNGTPYRYKGKDYLFCSLSHENASVLRKILPFTAPSRVLGEKMTFGTGDRLGTAVPGYIRALRKTGFIPVLAQQSVRELELTGRNYSGLIDSATWGVFQAGYTGPWGADGDHLKTVEWVRTALEAGCTMITADLSDHIRSEYEENDGLGIAEAYNKLPADYRTAKETTYLAKCVSLDNGDTITFSPETLRRIILVYKEAVDFAAELYRAGNEIKKSFDFEISIDETDFPTLPEAHVFVAEELKERGIEYQTVAPRFIGEFQKGIDYIGNVEEFERSFAVHAAVARHYGHKLSVHSGSDKFSVFPAIGRETGGRFHLKTSGTHWLQALSLIADTNPELFREVYSYALEVFPVTRTYYHITPDLSDLPDAGALTDGELGKILENVNSRQVLHVSYGEIYKNEDLKARLYGELTGNEEKYYQILAGHLQKHVNGLVGG
jgi:tagaturonate epimerase